MTITSPAVLPAASAPAASEAVFAALDLGPTPRDLAGSAASLSEEDRDSFLKQLARLLKHGVVGTETLEVKGRPHDTFVSTRMADPELAHARLYRPGERFDRMV